jgi:uncharacterized protein
MTGSDSLVAARPAFHLLAKPTGAGYKAFFGHVDRPMRMMSDLLRRGLPPSALVGWYRAEDERLRPAVACAGRNDPCPCGSGRKTKPCHGAAPDTGTGPK